MRRLGWKNTMKLLSSLMIVWLVPLAATAASGVEHPGNLPKGGECFSCHADKTRGKSVHSATVTACTVCHQLQIQDDTTTMNLATPKEQICAACHETSAELQKHSPVVKGQCVDCHDVHSSSRHWLLREGIRPGQQRRRVITVPHQKSNPAAF
jgi:predicted CXXCH cytochrome family protein